MLSRPVDISKSINFIHESNYKSRIAKLVTHAPQKQERVMFKPAPESAYRKSQFSNVFDFLSNERYRILTLNDLYDVINRQESSKQNYDWFRKRLKPIIKESGEFRYKSLFCVSSFYRLTDGFERELDHICHYHEFEEMSPVKEMNERALEYLKLSNPKVYKFKNLRTAVPLVNLDAPQGTAIFQTYYEYNYSLPKQTRETLEEKFRESVRQLTNKIGGMGKDCKAVHKEQKPCSKHSFCFLCKVEFEDYFGHIESENHKNSIHLHQRSYDVIDSMFDDLFVTFKQDYPSFSCYKSHDSPSKKPCESKLPLSTLSQPPTAIQDLNSELYSQLSKGSDGPQGTSHSISSQGDDDQEINVIVEERSNDFTNRKYNERHTPLKLDSDAGLELAKRTPKSIRCSQQIVSDMKSDCGYEDDTQLFKAEMIGKKHQINNLECNQDEMSYFREKSKVINLDESEGILHSQGKVKRDYFLEVLYLHRMPSQYLGSEKEHDNSKLFKLLSSSCNKLMYVYYFYIAEVMANLKLHTPRIEETITQQPDVDMEIAEISEKPYQRQQEISEKVSDEPSKASIQNESPHFGKETVPTCITSKYLDTKEDKTRSETNQDPLFDSSITQNPQNPKNPLSTDPSKNHPYTQIKLPTRTTPNKFDYSHAGEKRARHMKKDARRMELGLGQYL